MVWSTQPNSIIKSSRFIKLISEPLTEPVLNNYMTLTFKNKNKSPIAFYVIVQGEVSNLTILSSKEVTEINTKTAKYAEQLNYVSDQGTMRKLCDETGAVVIEKSDKFETKIFTNPDDILNFSKPIIESKDQIAEFRKNFKSGYRIVGVAYYDQNYFCQFGLSWSNKKCGMDPILIDVVNHGNEGNSFIFTDLPIRERSVIDNKEHYYKKSFKSTKIDHNDFLALRNRNPKIDETITMLQSSKMQAEIGISDLFLYKRFNEELEYPFRMNPFSIFLLSGNKEDHLEFYF